MKCFQHRANEALGFCKSCSKAVCEVCTIDTNVGLACSENCAKDVKEMVQVIERNKQVYNIKGGKSRILNPTVLMFLIMGSVMTSAGFLPYLLGKKPQYFTIIIGSTFLLLAFIVWRRTRDLNI